MSAIYFNMATIHNSELFRQLQDVAKLQQIKDKIPTELAEKIIPVIDVNPKHARIVNVLSSNNSSATGAVILYTTSTTKDFYLTSITAGFIKDATCDTATGGAGYSIQTKLMGGGTVTILAFPILTTTAQNQQIAISFPVPLKLERGTAITMNGAFTAGACARYGAITGYEIDNSNA